MAPIPDTHELLESLLQEPFPHLTLPEPSVWPRYAGLSVGNLPATILTLLGGGPGADMLPPLRPDVLAGMTDGVRRVVLVLIDGLGWLRLQRLLAESPEVYFNHLAQTGRLVPLTSLFPSTTNNVLTTLWTGAPPGRHGLIAYHLYLREWAMALEAVSFAPIFRPFAGDLDRWGLVDESFIPVPGMGQRLAAAGVPSEVVISEKIIGSALSRLNFRGVRRLWGHTAASDFWLNLRRILERSRDERLYVYGYWSALDTLAHRYGPWDESSAVELRSLDFMLQDHFLRDLSPAARRGTLFLLTADHGQVHTPWEEALIVEQHPELRDALLLPPVGESRAAFLYARAGKARQVREYLETHGAGRFSLYSRSEILRSGLLGPEPYHGEVGYRLGDWIALAHGAATLVSGESEARRLSGRHGSLSPEEMLVPLLAVRLDG